MYATPLLSPYRQGENRVTASLLAVLERLGMAATQLLLRAAVGDETLTLATFINQPGADGPGVPDAEISASFRLLIETKTARGGLDRVQIDQHLKRFEVPGAEGYKKRILLLLTPDEEEPPIVKEFQDRGAAWCSFVQLKQAIGELLDGEPDAVSAEQRVLLRELVRLFELDGLLGTSRDTLIVAGRWAYPWYLKNYAYVYQPDRTFRHVKHMGFYADGAIQPVIATILHDPGRQIDITEACAAELEASAAEVEHSLGRVVRAYMAEGHQGEKVQIRLLSPPDDTRTTHLGGPVKHHGQGRGSAWTMGHRYTSFAALTTGGSPVTPRRAADICGEMGAATEEARDRLWLAQALIAQNRRPEADVELQRALAFYRSVGATRYIREAEGLLAASA